MPRKKTYRLKAEAEIKAEARQCIAEAMRGDGVLAFAGGEIFGAGRGIAELDGRKR